MSKSLWPLLLLTLTACASRVAEGGTDQTLRAGDLELTVTAPAWVGRQELYPIQVTYTNQGKQAVEFSDPFHCSMIWNVQEVTSGAPLKPAGQSNFGCTANIPPLKTLEPNESYAGEFSAIISKYPAGQYRITPEQLQSLRPVNYRAGTVHEGYGPALTPAPQPTLFEIR